MRQTKHILTSQEWQKEDSEVAKNPGQARDDGSKIIVQ